MKRVETKRKQIDSELDRRRMKRRRDDDEFKVVEGVIDPPTLKILYKLLTRGTLSSLHGAISTGKEANVYHGENPEGNLVAVKIYRMSTAETDFMREYMAGDPRFKRVGKRSRVLIPQWAMKEFKNLKRYHKAGVKVPEPLDIERNVLVMEFIGDSDQGLAAPLIKNVDIPSPVETKIAFGNFLTYSLTFSINSSEMTLGSILTNVNARISKPSFLQSGKIE